MKTITLSADEQLIDAATERARSENTSLDALFRRWLADYTSSTQPAEEARVMLERMRSYVRTGGQHFTREEMNER
jgi:hypothetical protein